MVKRRKPNCNASVFCRIPTFRALPEAYVVRRIDPASHFARIIPWSRNLNRPNLATPAHAKDAPRDEAYKTLSMGGLVLPLREFPSC